MITTLLRRQPCRLPGCRLSCVCPSRSPCPRADLGRRDLCPHDPRCSPPSRCCCRLSCCLSFSIALSRVPLRSRSLSCCSRCPWRRSVSCASRCPAPSAALAILSAIAPAPARPSDPPPRAVRCRRRSVSCASRCPCRRSSSCCSRCARWRTASCCSRSACRRSASGLRCAPLDLLRPLIRPPLRRLGLRALGPSIGILLRAVGPSIRVLLRWTLRLRRLCALIGGPLTLGSTISFSLRALGSAIPFLLLTLRRR